MLAGGSNVVIGDAGFPGDVVLIRSRGVDVVLTSDDELTVRVAAGEPWDGFVSTAVASGWSGVECLAGIPGSAGATPIQNVGAYGQEVAETIVVGRGVRPVHGLRVPDGGAGVRVRVPQQRLQAQRPVGGPVGRLPAAPLAAVGAGALRGTGPGARRRGRRPGRRWRTRRRRYGGCGRARAWCSTPSDHDTWSVGSFFTNPVLDPEAYDALRARAADLGEPPSWPGADGRGQGQRGLADRAGRFHQGVRGTRRGRDLRQAHAGADQPGHGTTAALLDLAREIRDGVHARFGVTLHPEPVLVDCAL